MSNLLFGFLLVMLIVVCLDSDYDVHGDCRALSDALMEDNDMLIGEIERDDRLLTAFTRGRGVGEWDRACNYEIIAGEKLADGLIREVVIQRCEVADNE